MTGGQQAHWPRKERKREKQTNKQNKTKTKQKKNKQKTNKKMDINSLWTSLARFHD